ncbi:MAG: bifunctional (p)ppGpp synthetase/guanosine-3',5'-bis(diphosphate) 3'-pyrophosphohydrolase [Deltaproteobacteria bacterium]|nr:bifunctional (p)ppGpp synthetase/guanosine-3',5'-bis(diphosphate) 3'-pyrophosphohydrolase [Deltaproteobacteria bacterium]
MTALKSALLSSLLSGTPVTADLASLDAEELSFDGSERELLVQGMEQRLHHLRSGAPDRALLAEQTLSWAAPLAEQHHLSAMRRDLEEQSFAIVHPDAWAALSAQISPDEDSALLRQMLAEAQGITQRLEVSADITGRVKSLYSTHRKLERKGLALDELADRVALRLQLPDEASCYQALDDLHRRYAPVPSEFDDYIATPKANGYRSLHTAVVVPGSSTLVEFQLRTAQMHQYAERGDAAHWVYKLQA